MGGRTVKTRKVVIDVNVVGEGDVFTAGTLVTVDGLKGSNRNGGVAGIAGKTPNDAAIAAVEATLALMRTARHLRLGTHTDNMHDMVRLREAVRGDAHWTRRAIRSTRPGPKLTSRTVHAVRRWGARGIPRLRIAARFGITPVHVSNILTKRSWGALV